MTSLELENANPVVGAKNVDENGNITGLEAYKGETVFVLRAPKLPGSNSARANKALETPRALLAEFRDFARAHRELSQTQYRRFTEKYGKPADLVRDYAKSVTPEEFQAKVRELNTLVQKRFDEVSKEMNSNYEKLEAEFEAAVDRLFKGKPAGEAQPEENGNGATTLNFAEPATTPEPEPAPAVETTDATPRKAGRRGNAQNTNN